MKLKDSFVTQETDGEQIMVATPGSGFAGLVRSNATAAFIVECLKTETTKNDIVDAMCRKYDAPKAEIAEDVEQILSILRKIDALEE